MMTDRDTDAGLRWRVEDLAEATAQALALACLISPVVGMIENDRHKAQRDVRPDAA